MKTTAQLPIIGMDIAKNVFHPHIVDPETGEIERLKLKLKLKRDRVAAFFANRQPSLVAVEACWAPTIGVASCNPKATKSSCCHPNKSALLCRVTRQMRATPKPSGSPLSNPIFLKYPSRVNNSRPV